MAKEKYKGNENMYQICARHLQENAAVKAVCLLILLAGLSVLHFFGIDGSGAEQIAAAVEAGMEPGLLVQLILYKAAPNILIPVIFCAGVYINSRFGNQAVKELKEVIKKSGYYYERVNADFVTGSRQYLRDGILCIGMEYVILCHRDICWIREIGEVYGVRHQKFTHKDASYMGTEFYSNSYYIIILSKRGNVRFSCDDEISVELIEEEFASRGIYDGSEELKKLQESV